MVIVPLHWKSISINVLNAHTCWYDSHLDNKTTRKKYRILTPGMNYGTGVCPIMFWVTSNQTELQGRARESSHRMFIVEITKGWRGCSEVAFNNVFRYDKWPICLGRCRRWKHSPSDQYCYRRSNATWWRSSSTLSWEPCKCQRLWKKG